MTVQEFKSSLSEGEPPKNLTPILKSLWYDGKGDWQGAHNIAQDIHTHEGSWIHAYLHRKEGDNGNASYWYSKASRSMPTLSLQEEWEELVRTFITK
jgi:hypothetical protein